MPSENVTVFAFFNSFVLIQNFMLANRRHIRIKTMQSLYALNTSNSDRLDIQEKFLLNSIEKIRELYLSNLSIFIEIRQLEEDILEKSAKKYLATELEKNPNRKFVDNRVLKCLSESDSIHQALDQEKIKYFQVNDQYIHQLLSEIKEDDLYKKYMDNTESSFKEDQDFVLHIFRKIIAPNEKLYHFVEDTQISWADDWPVVNTAIDKLIKEIRSEDYTIKVPDAFKNQEDQKYALELLRKTAINAESFKEMYADKTKNWDQERIAELDSIVLNMAICELTKFPSIPIKVTINEYLEIVKEYSTPKSSIFINGILDSIIKELKTDDKIMKAGRGLIE